MTPSRPQDGSILPGSQTDAKRLRTTEPNPSPTPKEIPMNSLELGIPDPIGSAKALLRGDYGAWSEQWIMDLISRLLDLASAAGGGGENKIVTGLREAVAHARGEDVGATEHVRPIPTPAPDGGELPNKLTPGHPDAYLNALLDYTRGFYASAIAAGMRAASAADAVKHVESAARGLHRLALSSPPVPAPAGGVGESQALQIAENVLQHFSGVIAAWTPLAGLSKSQQIEIESGLRSILVAELTHTPASTPEVGGELREALEDAVRDGGIADQLGRYWTWRDALQQHDIRERAAALIRRAARALAGEA